MPELEPDNALAWRVFAVASSQMRVVGMGTPLGLEFAAIDRAMDVVGIPDPDRPFVFERVRLAGQAYAKQIRDSQESHNRERAVRNKQTVETRAGHEFPPMYDV